MLCFTDHTDLTFCHPSLAFLLLLLLLLHKPPHKSGEAEFCSVCLDMQRLLQHSSLFYSTGGPSFSSCASFSPHLSAGALRYAGAHSFMSDTELSHCEQFLFGSMLTNELSSASSEKSSQSGICNRKPESHSARKKIFIQLIKLNRFKSNTQSCKNKNVCCFHAVIRPNEKSMYTSGKEVIKYRKNIEHLIIKTNYISLI